MPVLFDKLGLQEAARTAQILEKQGSVKNSDQKDLNLEAFNDVVYALLFWDEIKYLANSVTHDFDFSIGLPIIPIAIENKKINKIIDFAQSNVVSEKAFIYDESVISGTSKIHGRSTLLFEPLIRLMQKSLGSFSSEYIHFGPIEYSIIANYLECTYLPASSRVDVLNEYYDFNQITIDARRKVYNYIDKEVQDYYAELKSKIGTAYISFKTPLLLQYLYSMSPKSGILDTAMKLRGSKELVNFRSWLQAIEKAVDTGDWVELNHCFRIIDDIVNDIKKIDNTIKIESEVTISFPPAITLPFSFMPRKRKVGCIFIRNLVEYGLRKRSMKHDFIRNTL